MTIILLFSLLVALLGSLAYMLGKRHTKQVQRTALAPEHLAVLRRIDKMILSNLSLPYLCQKVSDLLPDTGQFLGGTIRIAGEHGSLLVMAVTTKLQGSEQHRQLGALIGSSVTPEMLQRSQSLTAQAINERREVVGEKLVDFEKPSLTAEQAEQIQKQLGIKSIVSLPIAVEEGVSGAVTFYFANPQSGISAKDRELMQSVTDEMAVAVANARLTDQLERINHQLEEANVHLTEMDALKDEFISIASHQLRSPLTAVKGYLSMLREGDFGQVPSDQSPVLAQLAHSTNEVINLVNDMLSVSRIEARRFELSLSPVRLEDLVTEVVNELRPLAQQKSLALALSLPADSLGQLQLDAQRMRQVLINFIDNAIKYTPQGKVSVTLKKVDGDIVCTVRDTGIGIPQPEMKELFGKFFRASNAKQYAITGSGLGLYVVKRIVEDHHGQLIAESTEGEGSTFGFRIPLAAVAVATTEPAKSSQAVKA